MMKNLVKLKINNFPKEQTDAEVLSFLNDKVDKSISLTDLEILRSTSSTQIILGPGPSKAIVLKAIETLDFHKSQRCFYQDRRLYAKPFKPLSPVKQPPQHPKQPVVATTAADNKVKSAINSLEGKQETKTPVKATPASQAKKSSGSTAPIAKHKQSLASGSSKK